MKILVVGAGRMGGALIQGWTDGGLLSIEQVSIVESSEVLAQSWRDKGFQVEQTIKNASPADVVVWAVKPQVLPEVIDDVPDVLQQTLMISIAAGVTLETLQRFVPTARWVRAMPNQPSTVLEGATGLCAATEVTGADRAYTDQLFAAVGVTAWVESDQDMHAITALSGSGPAFVAKFVGALVEAGVNSGLSETLALDLALQTVRGTATQMQATGQSPLELQKAVSSPGGTTVAGLTAFEDGQVETGIREAVDRAFNRSQELANT